jgi:hypothetical protein
MRHFSPKRTKLERSVAQHAELRERAQQGANAAHLLDFASNVVLPDQEKTIKRRVFAMIDDPEKSLDPEIAAQAWIELRAAHKLIERLRKLKKGGEAAHIALADSPAIAESE